MLRFYVRRFLRRLVQPIAMRWYVWLFGANGVEGGDGTGCKTLVEVGSIDYDPRYPDRPPMIVIQVGLAVVPGPRIVSRTALSPADARELFRGADELITQQMKSFGDAEPRRFDTSQVVI